MVVPSATQKVGFTGNGLRISGPFRRNVDLTWEEVEQVSYRKWGRWIRIKGKNGGYFNSLDGISDYFDLVVVVAYRTGYRCPERVRNEVTNGLDAIDYAGLELMTRPKSDRRVKI